MWCIEVCCSSHCTLKLFPVKPPAPRNFTTVAILETEVRLKWSPPEFHEIYQVLHYVVEFKKFGEVWEERTTANQQINTYRLTDLESETSYLFKVSAKNKQGVGISSDVITKRTLAGAVNMFLRSILSHAISWRHPYITLTSYDTCRIMSINWTTWLCLSRAT